MIDNELRKIAKDLRLLGEDDLVDKVLCALSAVTGTEHPNADLSYSYVMRQLRKGDKERQHKFQVTFKEAFDEAIDNDIENPEEAALMTALMAIDYKEEELTNTADERLERMEKFATTALNLGNPQLAGKGIANIIGFLMQRIDSGKRTKLISKLKQKIWNLNELELYSKKTPDTAALGQAITFLKNVLLGHQPAYIREVLRYVVLNLR